MTDVRTLKRYKGQGGWTIDYDQLLEIKRKVDFIDEFQSLEDVEVIMLAAVKAGFARLEDRK